MEVTISATNFDSDSMPIFHFWFHILFTTLVDFENEGYLNSACSNPTNVVLVIVLSMIIGKVA